MVARCSHLVLLLLCTLLAVAARAEPAWLRPLPPIDTARLLVEQGAGPIASIAPLRLAAPHAMAAQQGWLYLADPATRRIYRHEVGRSTLQALTDFSGTPALAAGGADLSLYVADSGRRSVRQFAWDGHLVREFSDERLLARPVAIVPVFGGGLLVADALYQHLVSFSPFGRALRTIALPALDSLSAAVQGPDGLYLLDRAARRILVLGEHGVQGAVEGTEMLRDPFALAFDRYGRLYVADAFLQALVVFGRDGQPQALGAAALQVTGIAALAVDGDRLYVADTLAARIAVFKLAPATGGRP